YAAPAFQPEELLNLVTKECKSCLREITDPAELPCSHIFCTHCILEWANQQCKICKEEFPEDYKPTASEATR
uniref:RING-type domain-containing protein n=1 Tax=Malurus cyaneus samueli TaxID=2593467 RepID=A0A8C5TIT6_9PASS